MKRIALLMILVLGFSEPTLALQQPSPGQRDARVRTVTYDPANVVKVNGVIRASTQVVFADDEEVAHVAIGDSVAWEVAPAGSILFLKPREKHPPTNLQVVTTRADGRKRSYQFELSISETTLADSYFVVRFAYPGDEIDRRRAEAAARGAEREGALIDQTLTCIMPTGRVTGASPPRARSISSRRRCSTTARRRRFASLATVKLLRSTSLIRMAPKVWCRRMCVASSSSFMRPPRSSDCARVATFSASTTKPSTRLGSTLAPTRPARRSRGCQRRGHHPPSDAERGSHE